MRQAPRVGAIALVLALILCAQGVEPKPNAQPGGAQAQRKPPVKPRVRAGVRLIQRVERAGPEEATDSTLDGVFLPPDRTAKRRLEQARGRLEKREYGDAVRYLGSLMEASEDYFFRPDPRQPVYRSLKAEAAQLLADMPEEGLESYELQFGARARRMFDNALKAGDTSALSEVSRRFFFTAAGAEATLLVARHHMDHGQPTAAALCLERLQSFSAGARRFEPLVSVLLAVCWLQADLPDKASQALAKLKEDHPAAEVQIAGKPVKIFAADQNLLAMLKEDVAAAAPSTDVSTTQWTLFRGDPSRNARSNGGRPLLNHRWRQHTVDYEALERSVQQARQDFTDQDVPALPNLHPLAVGDTVLMRTWRNLVAVDFKTGKRIWQADPKPDDPIEQLVAGGRTQSSQAVARALQQRMWQDAAYGTLSSDGRLVFAVEELGIAPSEEYQQRTIFMPNGQRPRRSNRLVAYELSTQGMLAWGVGGNEERESVEPKLLGAFFLGAPLPLQGHLYALAEMKGQEIRLVVLSAETGALQWSQQLAIVEQNIALDPVRRLAGATPSFADGVLICPTSAGAVVAIDLTTRSLLWGYQYAREQSERMQSLRMGMYPGAERGEFQHWADGAATIADGRVLVTPVESEQLYCLSLVDGQIAWKKERGTNLYVACVHRGKVILVGQHAVTALELATGKPAWSQPLALPSGAMPSGRGFYSKERYFLPLSIGEVAEIDLDQGTIRSRARSRNNSVPGNLICFGNEVISQGVDYLDSYYQLEPLQAQVAQTLKTHPDDARALAQLGEIRLDEGNLTEAIDLFRRSYKLREDDHTRELLVTSILEGLRRDFAGHRNAAEDIETLIDRPEQRTTYLRLLAAGLQQLGQRAAAFDAYMKLAAQVTEFDELDEIEESLTVRRDCWLGGRLTELYKAADASERARIDGVVQARLATSLAANSADALRAFIGLYGGLPQGAQAREALLGKLEKTSVLERELLLTAVETSPVAAEASRATARLAALYEEAGRPDQAAGKYRKLLNDWPNEPCLDGKTGRQLAALAGSSVRAAMAGPKAWPVGEVAVQASVPRTLAIGQRQRSVELETRGRTSPAFRNLRVMLDTQQQAIIARDGYGAEKFRVGLSEQLSRRAYGFGAFNGSGYPTANYFNAMGNLMLLYMGNQLLALDTLQSQGSSSGAILWSQDMAEQISGVSGNSAIQTRPVNVPWGPTRYAAFDASGKAVGSLGPVSTRGICFQRFRELLCVEPLSGKTLWTRKNVPAGCELFGDDELLFVAPPEAGDALVLRMADGRLVSKQRVPSIEQRMATFGRKLLSWQLENAQPTLALTDLSTGTVDWKHAFAPGVKLWLADQENLAVMEPSGRLVVFSLPDGRQVVSDNLLPERSLSAIYLLPSAQQFILVTKSARAYPEQRDFYPLPGGLTMPAVTGRVYGFDRQTGKRLWKEPRRVEGYSLWLEQPSEVPILAMVRTAGATVTTTRRGQSKFSVIGIDKRTGREVLNQEHIGPSVPNTLEVTGDAATSTVNLSVPGRTYLLTLTDKPVPPEVRNESKLLGIGQAVLESVGNAVQRASGVPDALPGDDD